jgi:hypothetical protein
MCDQRRHNNAASLWVFQLVGVCCFVILELCRFSEGFAGIERAGDVCR